MRGNPLTKNTHSILHFAENKRSFRKPIAPHPPSPSPREFGLRLFKFQVDSSEFTRRGGAIFHYQKSKVSAIASQPSRAPNFVLSGRPSPNPAGGSPKKHLQFLSPLLTRFGIHCSHKPNDSSNSCTASFITPPAKSSRIIVFLYAGCDRFWLRHLVSNSGSSPKNNYKNRLFKNQSGRVP